MRHESVAPAGMICFGLTILSLPPLATNPETPVIGAYAPIRAPLAASHVKLDCKAAAAAGSTSGVADAMSVTHQLENFPGPIALIPGWGQCWSEDRNVSDSPAGGVSSSPGSLEPRGELVSSSAPPAGPTHRASVRCRLVFDCTSSSAGRFGAGEKLVASSHCASASSPLWDRWEPAVSPLGASSEPAGSTL